MHSESLRTRVIKEISLIHGEDGTGVNDMAAGTFLRQVEEQVATIERIGYRYGLHCPIPGSVNMSKKSNNGLDVHTKRCSPSIGGCDLLGPPCFSTARASCHNGVMADNGSALVVLGKRREEEDHEPRK
ncbi:hypothetical protein RRG08_021184 [Elysia crispata]|uniref:Uncharacterized protein n=1 Tax=Elysia crispata TaxID=231223 RepID=A0AAE0YPS5_9GAST|nr:hypothetical protein RRG08_021184 [Elysia crispata]